MTHTTDEEGAVVAATDGKQFIAGPKDFVVGVQPTKPLRRFPEGKIRIRMRAGEFAKAFVRTGAVGIRVFSIKDTGMFWEPYHQLGVNYTASRVSGPREYLEGSKIPWTPSEEEKQAIKCEQTADDPDGKAMTAFLCAVMPRSWDRCEVCNIKLVGEEREHSNRCPVCLANPPVLSLPNKPASGTPVLDQLVKDEQSAYMDWQGAISRGAEAEPEIKEKWDKANEAIRAYIQGVNRVAGPGAAAQAMQVLGYGSEPESAFEFEKRLAAEAELAAADKEAERWGPESTGEVGDGQVIEEGETD